MLSKQWSEQLPKQLSAQSYQKIDRELAKFPPDQKQSAVMAALAIAQMEKGWLPPEIMQEVADYLQMPAIAVQEVATFYNMYNVKPVGRFKISVCTNLPCALSGGVTAAEYLKEKLGMKTAAIQLVQQDAGYIEIQARDHLDMCRPGEVIFQVDSRIQPQNP